MEYLTIDNLKLSYYNERTKTSINAINNVSLQIPLGKTTAIIGQIGSGKTSLLKVISGVLPYDDGTITYKEKDIDTIYIEDRNFAYVSQDNVIFPKKTIFDNLAIPLLNRKLSKDLIRQKIYEVSESFGIGYLLSRKPKELSLGQIQKVNIAKAFLRDPDVFLLDEPFSHLDREFVEQFRVSFKKQLIDSQKTCLLITHIIEDALFLADYIAVLKDGNLIFFGPKERIYFSNIPEVEELINAETSRKK